MENITKAFIAAGTTLLFLAGPVVSANAANVAPASCKTKTTGGHTGIGNTYWARSGSVNKVSKFTYQITGAGTGGKSNVQIDHYENRTGASDRLVYNSPSQDNIKQDKVYTLNMSPNIQLPATKTQHTDFHFTFDTFGRDEKCKARGADFK